MRIFRSTSPTSCDRAGFLLAPLLYMLALGGIGAAVMFSGYSQVLRSNAEMTSITAARQQLSSAAQTLSASSALDAATSTIVQPPAAFDLAAVTDTARLPTGANAANATGSPTTFGVINIASGVRQLDPWGKYYIYCRWENPTATPAAPSIMVISGGPDGTLATKCGDAAAQSDDRVNKLTVAEAINRANVWQVNSASQVKFGMAGDAVKVNDDGSMQAGSLTLSTPLALNSGGTGAASAPGARAALSVPDLSGAGAMGLWGINVSGNAATSTRLSVPRTLSVAGASGLTAAAISFDGTTDVALTLGGTLVLASGGTGATTAVAARTNLGATATGDAVFTAGSVLLARSALGSSLIGDALFTAASAAAARTTLGSSSIGDALFTAVSAAAARTTLGLGTMATQNANAVAITGGTITGVTFTGNVSGSAASVDAAGVTGCCVAISAGGTGQSSAAASLTALGGDNASNLTTGTLAAARLPLISPTSAGTYNWGTVDSAGRVTVANDVTASNALQQGNSGVAVSDTGANGTVTITTEGVARLTVDPSGTGTFSGTVSASAPTASSHLTTKAYVDAAVAGAGGGGGGLKVYDYTGAVLGYYAGINTKNSGSYYPVTGQTSAVPYIIPPFVTPTGYVFYSGPNCSGTVYSPYAGAGTGLAYGCTGSAACQTNLVVSVGGGGGTYSHKSHRQSGTCYSNNGSAQLYPTAAAAPNNTLVPIAPVYFVGGSCTGIAYFHSSYASYNYIGYACTGSSTCTTNPVMISSDTIQNILSYSYRNAEGLCADSGGWTVPVVAVAPVGTPGLCGMVGVYACTIGP